MSERDFNLPLALKDPNLGPQLREQFANGPGREFLPARLQELFQFKDKYGPRLGQIGDWTKGEIEILNNPEEIFAAEEAAANQLIRQGLSEEEARLRTQAGIRAQTRWGVSICDAVKFPGGFLGTYVREISWPQLEQGLDGIAVIPVLEDGRVAIPATYRHATRRWGLEIPKGGTDPDGITNTIKRELSQEAGVEIIGEAVKLGTYTPDNGILASNVPLFLARVRIVGQPIPEESEAIGKLLLFTKEELLIALNNGTHTDSEGKIYDFTDGFTKDAIRTAIHRGLI